MDKVFEIIFICVNLEIIGSLIFMEIVVVEVKGLGFKKNIGILSFKWRIFFISFLV